MVNEDVSRFGCTRRLIILHMPTQPHSNKLVLQKKQEGAKFYEKDSGKYTDIQAVFHHWWCFAKPNVTFVQLVLRKTEFAIGEDAAVDVICDNAKSQLKIDYTVAQLIKRSWHKVANPPDPSGKTEPFSIFEDEQIVLTDGVNQQKYGCWSEKYKEFTLRVHIPNLELYSGIQDKVPDIDSDDEDAVFNVHNDEKEYLGKALSPTTNTELVRISYSLRYYVNFVGKGDSPFSTEIPVKIVSNPVAEKESNDRFAKKPRGWLPLTSPEQIMRLEDQQEYNA